MIYDIDVEQTAFVLHKCDNQNYTDIIAQKHFMLRYFPCFEEGIFH